MLVGLSRAPDLLADAAQPSHFLHPDLLGAVVVPEGALGSEAVLACMERSVPVIGRGQSLILKSRLRR